MFQCVKSLFRKKTTEKLQSKVDNEVVNSDNTAPVNDSSDKPDIKVNDTKTLSIKNKFLPENCYTQVNTRKKRICLHHTVSSPLSIDGDLAAFSSQRNIATQYIIGGDGTVYRLIPENYWAHHLGTTLANNTQLNQETIGIEIDAWGQLTRSGSSYLTAYGSVMDANLPVETLDQPFRGSLYYQEYFDAQMDALYLLLKKLSAEQEIPLKVLNETLDFELYQNFDNPGLYSHSNFRADKSDAYPAKKLIAMLKTL
jgi:N-acetyl-anhydromuramyl-L-alanine amidase AmpD